MPFVEKQVFGFDIAMNETQLATRLQSARRLECDGSHRRLSHPPGFVQRVVQHPALEPFHDDIKLSVHFPDEINLDHMGMIDGRCGARFVHEGAQCLRVLRHLGEDHLDGDAPARLSSTA